MALGPLCHEPTVWLWDIHFTSLGIVHYVNRDLSEHPLYARP